MPRALDAAIAHIGREVARATAACLHHPFRTLAVYALLCAFLGTGATNLDRMSSFLGFLPEGSRELRTYEAFLEEYASNDLVLVATQCPPREICENVFEPRVLSLLGELERALRAIPGVQQVTGPLSAPVLGGGPSHLYTRRLEEVDPAHPSDVRRLADELMSDPRLVGSVVSADERTAGVFVRFGGFRISEDGRHRFVDALLEVLHGFEERTGMTTYAVGDLVAASLVNRYTREDLELLTPFMFGVVLLIFAWLFRDVTAAVAPLVTVGIAVTVPFGLMGLLGVPITVLSSTLPILIVVIGVTDSMHLVTRFFHHAERGRVTREALERAAGELGVPSLVTALTGSAGLLAFLLSPMPHFREFGLFGAIGVLSAFVTTFTLLPVLFLLFQPTSRPRPSLELTGRALMGVHAFATGRWVVLLMGVVVITVAGLVGLKDLRVQNDWLGIVDRHDYIYRSEQFVRENLRPTRTVEVLLEARNGATVTDGVMLREARAVESRLALEPRFGRVDSVFGILRRVQEVIGGDGVHPDGGAREALFLASSATPDLVRSFVTLDQRGVRFSAGFHYSDSRTDLALLEALLEDLKAIAPSWEPSITGLSSLNPRIGELVLETQIASFSGAFAAIFVVLSILLGSFRLAALGMIPNVLPVIVILGLMGYWSIRLDVGTAMVATILIGISVDDTVYFLVHYRNARRRRIGVKESIRYAFEFSGRAAVFSTLILASGFVLLGFSRFRSLAYFGFLSSLAVVLAVLAELLVLPALLIGATKMMKWLRRPA